MSFVGIAGKYQKFYTAIALKAKMSSSVFLEGAVTTADKAVDGDTGGKLGKKSRLRSNSPCKSSVTSCSASRSVCNFEITAFSTHKVDTSIFQPAVPSRTGRWAYKLMGDFVSFVSFEQKCVFTEAR